MQLAPRLAKSAISAGFRAGLRKSKMCFPIHPIGYSHNRRELVLKRRSMYYEAVGIDTGIETRFDPALRWPFCSPSTTFR